MIEVGNSPDFSCSADSAALARCQAHFTMWTIMKAPLILGNNIPKMDSATLSVLANAEAIAVNQDALGIQAQRVASSPPPPSSSLSPAAATPLLTRGHTAAVLARCNAARPTQAWRVRAGDGALATRDAAGAEWCLQDALGTGGEAGSWAVAPCDSSSSSSSRAAVEVTAAAPASGIAAQQLLQLRTPAGAALGWCTAHGASGPLPHTRYLTTAAAPGAAAWEGDAAALRSPTGSALRAAAGARLPEGSGSGPWCLEATAEGQLEVWAGPLTGGRFAVALFNRAAAPAPITATFSAFNASGTFAVRDVWAAADMGSHAGSYTASVASRAVAYLILTPA